MRNSLLYMGIRAIINEPEWKEECKDLKDRKRGGSILYNISYLLDELTGEDGVGSWRNNDKRPVKTGLELET
jgi:hypothetical protein